MARAQKAQKVRAGGSPGEPQTAKKAAEQPAPAPRSASDDDDDEVEAAAEEEEEEYEYECGVCGGLPDVHDDAYGALCQRHAFEEELAEERKAAQPRPADGTRELRALEKREAELKRLAERRAAGQESESDGDEGLSVQKRQRRALARETLRLRYALRHAPPADLARRLRAAVQGSDEQAAKVVRALAAVVPRSRFPSQARSPAVTSAAPALRGADASSFALFLRAQPVQLARCARCKVQYDASYPVAGACRLLHRGKVRIDSLGDCSLRCRRCERHFACWKDGTLQRSTEAECFRGTHTTSRRRAAHERDGDCTSVDKSDGTESASESSEDDGSDDYSDDEEEEEEEEELE